MSPLFARAALRGAFSDSLLPHAELTGGSGVQWPCNEEHPDGCERLYTDFQFPTTLETVESYGHDLFTGTVISSQEFKAMNPDGRAILKACHYHPQEEFVSDDYPFRLMCVLFSLLSPPSPSFSH